MPSLMVRTKMIFNELVAIDARLKELGIAAESVLKEAKKMYKEHGEDTCDQVKQFKVIAMKAKSGLLSDQDDCKNFKRCQYWNRGYCREAGSKCLYYDPPDDCQQHLQEGRCSNQGCGQRHRKICKYWNTRSG